MKSGTTPMPARKTRLAARVSRRRLRLTTALSASLLLVSSFATLPSPAFAQTATGGTLGIDCDKPRYNEEGKLIISFDRIADDARRAICEADRTTALTYAGVVRETRDRLRSALRRLPPPVRGDLVEHLRTDDAVSGWTYSDAGVMALLQSLSAGATPPTIMDGTVTADRAHGVAAHWAGGILAGSGVATDWQRFVRARACGVDASGATVPGAAVLVWLDPSVVRDRWTPRMVQRTARAWLERTMGDRFVAVDHVPDVVTPARQLARVDGRVRDISGNAAVQACFASVPQGALAMRTTLSVSADRGERLAPCDDPDQVGVRTFAWQRVNGVFVVPEVAVLPDGSDHPDRGAPLLGQRPDLPLATTEADAEFLRRNTCREPGTIDAVRAERCDAEINGTPVLGTHVRRFRFREVQNDPADPLRIDLVPVGPDPLDPDNGLGVIAPPGPHPVWETVTLFCEGELPPVDAPPVPPRDEVADTDADWTVPDCATQWAGQFEQGERTGYRQVITYPAGWPVDEIEVRTIDDDCFNPVRRTGTQKRALRNCPAGMVGGTIEDRSFSWWTKAWAVGNPSHARQIPTGHGSVAQAAAAYDANPSQAGLDVWDVVTLEEDWHVVANTCRTPSSGGDDDDDDSGGGNYDVDGDGVGDFDNEADANAYSEHFGTPGSRVEEVDNCGDCQGHGGSQRPPSRPDQDEDSSDNEDNSDGGGGWG